MKTKISYWTLLVFGIILNGFQVYKYLTNQLEYSMLELVVLVVGVCFNFAPKKIITIFENKFIEKK